MAKDNGLDMEYTYLYNKNKEDNRYFILSSLIQHKMKLKEQINPDNLVKEARILCDFIEENPEKDKCEVVELKLCLNPDTTK